jgi:hypothetical protein
MKKLILIIGILAVLFPAKRVFAQVPNPVIEKTCGSPSTQLIASLKQIKCMSCCEYNTQSGIDVKHKCITPSAPNCTEPFLNGYCNPCFVTQIKEPDGIFNMKYGIICVAGINLKWYFDPFASTTKINTGQFQTTFEFVPLDGNYSGINMTTQELNIFNP